MKETHYLPALCEHNGRQRLTACNRWIRATEHTNEPTCPTCKAYVEDSCRELNAVDLFGAFDALTVVKPQFAANSDRQFAGYREKR